MVTCSWTEKTFLPCYYLGIRSNSNIVKNQNLWKWKMKTLDIISSSLIVQKACSTVSSWSRIWRNKCVLNWFCIIHYEKWPMFFFKLEAAGCYWLLLMTMIIFNKKSYYLSYHNFTIFPSLQYMSFHVWIMHCKKGLGKFSCGCRLTFPRVSITCGFHR